MDILSNLKPAKGSNKKVKRIAIYVSFLITFISCQTNRVIDKKNITQKDTSIAYTDTTSDQIYKIVEKTVLYY